MPPRVELPFFAYGLLMPGELAHGLIEELVERSVASFAEGALYARDGLPLFDPSSGGMVNGYLLDFADGGREEAYKAICSFEPQKHYRWREVHCGDARTPANVLVGKRVSKGSILLEEGEWTGRNDPVLTVALELVTSIAVDEGRGELESAPPDTFDWRRFFALQMAYLLLWTIIERFAALRYGPSLEAGQKVQRRRGGRALPVVHGTPPV